MKLFQITHKYQPYIAYFEKKYNLEGKDVAFDELIHLLIEDGFMYSHLLKPIVEHKTNGFYTIWNYERLQLQWAKENNIDSDDLLYILSKQIEYFQPEVIYNMSPQGIDSSFFSAFDSKIICWNADPFSIDKLDFSDYDALLTSAKIVTKRIKNAYLHYPSNIKQLEDSSNNEKTIDLFFYGQYAKDVFVKRNETIKKLLKYCKENNINEHFHIMYSYWAIPFFNINLFKNIPFLRIKKPSRLIVKNVKKPIFGNDITLKNKKSKIVFNMSAESKEFGDYKFNMRIFETLGAGAFMLSDEGIYPEHIVDGRDFVSYKDFEDLKEKIKYYLEHEEEREQIALNGKKTIEKYYSKEKQWENFKTIVENI